MSTEIKPADIADRAECDACGFETLVVRYPRRGYDPARHVPEAATARLCALCAHTGSGRITALYRSDVTNEDILRAVSFVGNVILQAIRTRQ